MKSQQHIRAEYVAASPANWNLFGERLMEIEREAFGDLAFSAEAMRADIDDPSAVLILLRESERIVGFAYALPEGEKTACVVDIVIEKSHRGRGLVAPIMACMEARLKEAGYEWLVEHAMVDNGYADKIERNYGGRIVESGDFVGEYGRQRHFRIRL